MKVVLFAAVVLRLSHTDPQSVKELATITRSTADILELSVNADERSITVNGTPQQNAIAEWLVPRLDVAGPRPIGAPYKAGPEDMAQVFYVNNTEAPQQLIELTTTARSLAEVPRAFVYQPAKAFVARGTADQIALIEWLLPHLDVRGPQSDAPQYRVGGKTDDLVRLFYLNHAQTEVELHEILAVTRSIAEIRRAFTYTAARAAAMRATPDQIAVAEFLLQKLNKPAGAFTSDNTEYRIPGQPDGVIRLFSLKGSTVQDMRERTRSLREATGMKRAFACGTCGVLAVRGTPEQVTEAARLLGEH